MPRYAYQTHTGLLITRVFPMGEAPEFLDAGGMRFQRIFSAPQLTLRPAAFREENKMPWSQTEWLEKQRQGDKDYEKSWEPSEDFGVPVEA